VDAIIATTGNLFFGPLVEMTAENFNQGLQDKLLGQVRLALKGQHMLNDGGSITLTSGIIADEPIYQGVNATAVNAALAGFVKAAACELPRGIRINLVSPTMLTESAEAYGDFFPGFESVPAARVALAYRKSVEGIQSGQVFKVGY
jgi:NAD(P)-dependent dehydrogenase (short-subunit alcohol dehydrogenase family)